MNNEEFKYFARFHMQFLYKDFNTYKKEYIGTIDVIKFHADDKRAEDIIHEINRHFKKCFYKEVNIDYFAKMSKNYVYDFCSHDIKTKQFGTISFSRFYKLGELYEK